jgi:hypothetical protein
MRKGTHQTPEAIEKMRKSKTGKKDSPETIEKKRLSHLGENNAFFGKKHTRETLELLKGPKSELHKQHLSEAKRGKIPANIEILKNSRKGKTNSDFQKQRSKEALTGLKRSEETIELNRLVHTGLTQSEEAREKNRIAHIGEKNHAWKGGVTVFNESIRPSSKYLAWRDAVYKRDFEEALACEELWDVSNGITMIEKNHIAYHSRSGTPE